MNDADDNLQLPVKPRLGAFIADFHAIKDRYVGRRLTRQYELLVRAVIASSVSRAYKRGILPDDAQLVVTRTPDGLAFRIVCEQGVVAEDFLPDCRAPRAERSGSGAMRATQAPATIAAMPPVSSLPPVEDIAASPA